MSESSNKKTELQLGLCVSCRYFITQYAVWTLVIRMFSLFEDCALCLPLYIDVVHVSHLHETNCCQSV